MQNQNGSIVKIYFPDGHLEKPIWDAMVGAGYKLKKMREVTILVLITPILFSNR